MIAQGASPRRLLAAASGLVLVGWAGIAGAEPHEVLIKRSTPVYLAVAETLSSETAKAGATVSLRVAFDVRVQKAVVEAGTIVTAFVLSDTRVVLDSEA